jgi:hypothetical protein
VAGASAPLQHAIAAGAHHAFMSGLHIAILVAAVAAFAAAALGLLLQRSEASTGAAVAVF